MQLTLNDGTFKFFGHLLCYSQPIVMQAVCDLQMLSIPNVRL